VKRIVERWPIWVRAVGPHIARHFLTQGVAQEQLLIRRRVHLVGAEVRHQHSLVVHDWLLVRLELLNVATWGNPIRTGSGAQRASTFTGCLHQLLSDRDVY